MAGGQRVNGLVLIADGDCQARAGISNWMVRAGYRVLEAATGPQALDLVRLERPQVVLLEPALPDICGYEVCKQIRDELGDAVRIIFISATRTEQIDHVAGMLIGADYCLSKPVVADELLARVRRLLQRSVSNNGASGNGHSPGHQPVSRGRLTARELEVLRGLADGLGQRELAAGLFISTRTVGSHIEHILAKLDVRSRAQAVATAYRNGLLLETTRDGREENGVDVSVG